MLLRWGDLRGQHVLLYMRREPGNWSAPGDVLGWDGDLDQPTLHPSMLVQSESGGGWHGYLRAGVLVDA